MAQFTARQMTSTQTTSSRWQRTVILSGLGFMSGMSLFAGQEALAQSVPADPALAQPTPLEPDPVEAMPPVAPAAIAPDAFPIEFATPPPLTPRSQPVAPVAAPPPIAVPPAETYIAPNTIIFSERSTGCQTTVQAGQAPSGICRGSQPGVSQVPVPGWQGANGQPAGSASAVGVSGLSVVAPSVRLGATPSLRDFYQRTLRPPARLGNGNIRLIFPLALPAPISSLFGWRLHPLTGDLRFHSGTDLAAPIGTPVLAAYAGQVALADFLGGYGLTVAIDHTKGTQQTLYAHLSEIFVQSGDTVKQGEVIGRVGSTGNSTGPHLHFELRQLTAEGWVAIDAGAQLEYALAQLVNSLEVAQVKSISVKANAGVQGVIQ